MRLLPLIAASAFVLVSAAAQAEPRSLSLGGVDQKLPGSLGKAAEVPKLVEAPKPPDPPKPPEPPKAVGGTARCRARAGGRSAEAGGTGLRAAAVRGRHQARRHQGRPGDVRRQQACSARNDHNHREAETGKGRQAQAPARALG